MDYEQKYKEALERAKSFELPEYKNIMVSIFPELAESEDEKIREGLIELVKYAKENCLELLDKPFNVVSMDAMLTWIENLSEQKNKINSCKITFEDVLALECAIKTIKITEGSDELYKILVHLYNKIHNAYLVEKQCKEEEPQVYETENGEIITYSETDGYKVIGPKFKVGDYIVNDYCMGRVVEITDDAYLLDTEQGIPFSCHSTRLWDVTKDAKDGDVLVDSLSGDNQITILFKSIELDTSIRAYIGWNCYNFRVTTDGTGYGTLSSTKYVPATKEQRDLLFKKMKEAGYEWDADKKELKKINSYCQENCKGYQETGKCFADGGCDAKRKAEQKSTAWSEKDDKAIESLLHTLDSIEDEWFHDMTEEKYWLKSIKNRLTTK